MTIIQLSVRVYPILQRKCPTGRNFWPQKGKFLPHKGRSHGVMSMLSNTSFRKVAGFSLLALAVTTWVIAASLPFLGLSVAELAVGTTIIVVLGEGAFWLSMFFLGSQYWSNIKGFFCRRFSSEKDNCSAEA